jgi:UDP-N-acetylmuramoylalanine--D-glutamate ligase
MTIAIFGLGRSGLAVAEAVIKLGKQAIVYDENPREKISKNELVQEAENLGATLVLGNPFPLTLTNQDIEYVVTNPAIDHRHPALQSLKNEGTEVIGEVEFAYRISKAPIVAITGTNGKSTTVAMTTIAIRATGKDAIMCGNIFGSGLPEQPLTTAAMNSTRDQVLVAEISSFQLEWVKDFKPKAAAITSIANDHLDRYDAVGQYVNAKLNIFRAMDATDLAVFPYGMAVRTKAKTQEFRYRFADFYYDDRVLHIFNKQISGDEFRILGDHNIMNAGIAATLAQFVCEPNSEDKILDAIKQFEGLSHRMEFVAEKRGIAFINNSMCTNPAALKASLQSIPKTVNVLIGGVNKDLSFKDLKDFFERRPIRIQLFGKDAEQINRELGRNYQVWSTMKQAFDAATNEAKDGEIVMLAPGCASTDQFRDFRHRGDVFKTYVMDWTE